MEKDMKVSYKAHCLVLPFPLVGHINPILQFSKCLETKGIKVTLVTNSLYTQNHEESYGSIVIDTISDGYDGGVAKSESTEAYLKKFQQVGSVTLSKLIEKLDEGLGCKVDCLVYDAVLPWALNVAKDMDCDFGSFSAVFDMVVNQFANIEKADWVLCNTFDMLEQEVSIFMSNLLLLKTIGLTIPLMYLDKQIQDDREYGLTMYKPDTDSCMKWLNEQPNESVIYVSFGSMAQLEVVQVEELCLGLKRCNDKFLWVVRESEQTKLPRVFKEGLSDKGLVVSWCPQLEVLADKAIGCFVTHCGWNSTLEALSLGVPMVALPQWSDQSTNAKYIMDFWKVGVKALADERRIVRWEVIEGCIKEVMQGERREEIKRNTLK